MNDLELILEFCMIALFGISWPISVIKSYRARSVGSKSLIFLLAIWTGYIFGILRKALYPAQGVMYWITVGAYAFNMTMITIDTVLYFRNRRLDRLAAERADTGAEAKKSAAPEKAHV